VKKFFFIICLAATVAACDSAEERAEEYYQSALELVERSDTARALIELRNVFDLNGQHREARRLYADLVLEQGNTKEAYSQYLRLLEQYPDDVDANRKLAELTLDSGGFQQARKLVDVVLAADPENPEVRAMDVLIDYHSSVGSDRTQERSEALNRAYTLLDENPSLLRARQVVLSQLVGERDWNGVLEQVDAALEYAPNLSQLYRLKLQAMERLADDDGIEATLLEMAKRFPDDRSIGKTLVRWYIGKGRLDEAEARLKAQIDPQSPDPQPRLTLVEFLARLRGPEAALEELGRIEALTPPPRDVENNIGTFASLRAGLMFNTGEQKAAMLRLEGLLDGAEPGNETDRMKVALAEMREKTGNSVGARALVEEVLERDPTQVGALKMKASWLIEADETGDAIITLRKALDQSPRDTSVITLLAQAYEREGNRELVGYTLQQAVEASNRAPDESMRMARYYMQDGQYRSAEDALLESLRLNRDNVDLLRLLGDVHIEMEDWGRVEQVVGRLREVSSGQANSAADELEAKLLLRQRKTDDLMAFVESRLKDNPSGEPAVIRTLVLTGQLQEAVTRAEAYYSANPDSTIARFVYASTLTYVGADDRALPLFEAVVEEDPSVAAAWSSLYGIHSRAKRHEEALSVLNRAEAALPDDTNLSWLRAGHHEGLGEIEKAIAIYEAIYAENSNLPVIANNLASLLSTARQDEESMQRAYVVARRLRDSDVPAFQDTYGWIAYRRGDLEDAKVHLEPAAEGLPNDASVQYHLGQLYADLDRVEDARRLLSRSIELIEQGGKAYPGLVDQATTALEALPEPGADENGESPAAGQ